MSARRRVAVVSVSRSDYGHLTSVLAALRDEPSIDVRLLVGGMHLSHRFGHTIDMIETDGWPIAERLDFLEADDAPAAIARSMGRGVAAFSDAYARQAPDVVVVLGDRFEMLSAAAATLPFALPLAHIHGGEITEGAMDNQIRHAITKLAHVHLVSAVEHAQAIASMGEESWRIHTVGGPGLDRIRTTPLLPASELAARLGLPPRRPWILVTYHPVTLEHHATGERIDALLAALDKVDGTLVMTYPNADTAGRTIIARLEELRSRSARVVLVPSLGDRVYLSLLAHADVMVGNSSSGLIEAPSFALPVVNVGGRQRGRLRAQNVVDVGDETDDILGGIERALDARFRAGLRGMANPYGDGHAAPRIARILAELRIDARLVQKRGVST